MEKLITSMMRFSTAVTLFGVEQMQNAVNSMSGKGDFDEAMEKFRSSLDSFTDAMAQGLDENKREALESFTRVSEDTVHKTMKDTDMSRLMDPRTALQASADLLKKTSDSMTDMMQQNREEETESDKPQPAAEALSKSAKKA